MWDGGWLEYKAGKDSGGMESWVHLQLVTPGTCRRRMTDDESYLTPIPSFVCMTSLHFTWRGVAVERKGSRTKTENGGR